MFEFRAQLMCSALLVLGSGCGATQVRVSRLAPAEVTIPVGKPIAITQITGAGSDRLSAELTQAVVETKRFQVLERQQLQPVMAELGFSAAGHISDETAISFGQMTGAATLIMGDVLGDDYDEKVTSVLGKCTKDGTVYECTQFTRTAEATLRVSLKVLETETGRVLAAKSLSASRKRSAQATDTEPAPIQAKDEMITECRTELVQSFVAVIAPHEVTESVSMPTDGDLPELEAGHKQAQVANWPVAIEKYEAAVARSAGPEFDDEQRGLAKYCLGVGLAYSGSFDEGIEQLERALALNPDPMFKSQLETVRRFKAEAAKLAEQQ
ncbi:MAG: hypothetical protein HY791_08220 [Deltaproteobacteria bacterium]|nr:hypothetical protein [Deltaproteobacteria bacterium]